MATFLLFLVGCNGCRPNLPTDDGDDTRQDTADSADTADTSGETAESADTSPELPPRCDLLEIEPNNTLDEIQTIPMEQWLCGGFGKTDSPLGDIDFLTFTPGADGWLEVSMEAANRGSSADAQFTLFDDDNSLTALDGYLTTDPKVVIPAPAHAYSLALGETSYASGDAYNWAILASEAKAPVEWTGRETESNDSYATANEFPIDATVFGTIERAGDFDWYHLLTPADADSIVFTVEATAYGSPLDATLILYEADGTTIVHTDTTGEVDYDRDPWFEQKQTGANDWYLLVKNVSTGGSDFHWYTLTINALYEPDSG